MKSLILVFCTFFLLSGCQTNLSRSSRGAPQPPKFVVVEVSLWDSLFQSEAVNSYCKQEIINFDPGYSSYETAVFDAVRNADIIKIVSGSYEINREDDAENWLKKHGAKGKIERWSGGRCDGKCTPTWCCPITICFEYGHNT